MSDALDRLLIAIGEKPALQARLSKEPAKVFAEYPGLTDAEKVALTKLAEPPETSPWPQTFKDIGAAALSVVTVVFFGVAVWLLIAHVSSPPVFTAIPNTNPAQSVSFEPFDRVQGLFNAVLPLFGGLFAYWLGVQVEGRRADQAEERADASAATAESEKQGKEALLAVATPDVVQAAQAKYPNLFPQGR